MTVGGANIGGVTVRRHVLDHEAARLIGVAQRLGKRIQFWFRSTPVDKLPGPDELETFRLYSNIVLQLLKEQRERHKLARLQGLGDVPTLTDEQAEELRRQLVSEAIAAMPQVELDELLAKRRVCRNSGDPPLHR